MTDQQARRLASVTPGLAAAFMAIAADFAEEFPGCRMAPAQGYRTPEQQITAAQEGRSNADGVRTFSKHQMYPSLALDFAILDESGRYVSNGSDPRYAWVGKQFEAAGFVWGGRWNHPDWDHAEMPGPAPTDVSTSYALYHLLSEAAPTLRLA